MWYGTSRSHSTVTSCACIDRPFILTAVMAVIALLDLNVAVSSSAHYTRDRNNKEPRTENQMLQIGSRFSVLRSRLELKPTGSLAIQAAAAAPAGIALAPPHRQCDGRHSVSRSSLRRRRSRRCAPPAPGALHRPPARPIVAP